MSSTVCVWPRLTIKNSTHFGETACEPVGKTIFFGLLLSQIGLAQDSALQAGKDALAAIQKISREVPRATPESMTESLNKMEKVIDGVDQESLCQSPQGGRVAARIDHFQGTVIAASKKDCRSPKRIAKHRIETFSRQHPRNDSRDLRIKASDFDPRSILRRSKLERT